jgi:hypothetical protein
MVKGSLAWIASRMLCVHGTRPWRALVSRLGITFVICVAGFILTTQAVNVSLIASSSDANRLTAMRTEWYTSVVIDRLNLARTCCSVHNCQVPLSSPKHRYCHEHQRAGMDKRCGVVNCDSEVTDGFLTCADPSHRALEVEHVTREEAMFQKRANLRRANAAQTHDSLPSLRSGAALLSQSCLPPGRLDPGGIDLRPLQQDALRMAQEMAPEEGPGDSVYEGDDDHSATDKPDAGNRPRRTRFTRRWTHNEQICVTSCGVILGRVTFYGSESIKGVRVSVLHIVYQFHHLMHE